MKRIYSKKKLKKKQGIKELKRKLWKEFSLHTKLLHQTKKGFCKCFTCGKEMEIGKRGCHTGHWLTKKGFPVHYFEPDNVRPQCYYCNAMLSGNSEVFRRNLEEEIGKERIDDLYSIRNIKVGMSIGWYKDLIEFYKNENKKFNL